jgi:hypothetical protein
MVVSPKCLYSKCETGIVECEPQADRRIGVRLEGDDPSARIHEVQRDAGVIARARADIDENPAGGQVICQEPSYSRLVPAEGQGAPVSYPIEER